MAKHPIPEIRPAVIAAGGFVQNESYLHQHAKEVVAGWLRETSEGPDGYLGIHPVLSRPNRPAPHSGVWVEYPILRDGTGAVEVWDEINSDRSALGATLGLTPTFEDLSLEEKARVACVCDIAIAHKGRIGTVVEIVHRHPTPDWKVRFLCEMDIHLVELCATRIMRAVRCPASFGAMLYRGAAR